MDVHGVTTATATKPRPPVEFTAPNGRRGYVVYEPWMGNPGYAVHDEYGVIVANGYETQTAALDAVAEKWALAASPPTEAE